MKPDVLVVDAFLPTPDHDGGSLRMVNMLRVLGELADRLTFAAVFPSPPEARAEVVLDLGVELLDGPEALEAHLREAGDEHDAVIVSRPQVAAQLAVPIRRLAPRALLLYDTLDLHHVCVYE